MGSGYSAEADAVLSKNEDFEFEIAQWRGTDARALGSVLAQRNDHFMGTGY